MNCNEDSCEVETEYTDDIDAWAKRKVERWMLELEPIDYDAPGTTARETGV